MYEIHHNVSQRERERDRNRDHTVFMMTSSPTARLFFLIASGTAQNSRRLGTFECRIRGERDSTEIAAAAAAAREAQYLRMQLCENGIIDKVLRQCGSLLLGHQCAHPRATSREETEMILKEKREEKKNKNSIILLCSKDIGSLVTRLRNGSRFLQGQTVSVQTHLDHLKYAFSTCLATT